MGTVMGTATNPGAVEILKNFGICASIDPATILILMGSEKINLSLFSAKS